MTVIRSIFCGAMVAVCSVVICYGASCLPIKVPKTVNGSLSPAPSTPSGKLRKELRPGNLGYSVDQLSEALVSGTDKIATKAVCNNGLFKIQFSDIRIFGSVSRADGKIVDVCVKGNGPNFDDFIKRIIFLTSPDKLTANSLIVQLVPSKTGRPDREVYLQLGGVRYHRLVIKGVRTFHCVNAKADDIGFQKGQPG